MRVSHALNQVLQRQRGALMPWSPVFMGLGVALYFQLKHEPEPLYYAGALVLLLAALAVAWRWREVGGPLGFALAFFALGAGVAGLRAHMVAGPVLDGRYYGAIEGEIVTVDRSASDAIRVTLADVVLEDLTRDQTPRRVRLSLFGDQGYMQLEPGARMIVTGHLTPPGGPAEPGGFDFQRHAWYLGLGGLGYTRSPALLLVPREAPARLVTHLRLRLSRGIQARIEGQPGAFAAAVTTGDRSGLSRETLADMRGSNIAHLLAISGLHMGLLTGFVFGALRLGLAAVPALALRFPIRKWAAAAALCVAALYLALSGGNVATERAFIQVSVMLVAVMLDRRAITLRSVAIAAIIVLLRRPETLLSPGFQMSFAATAALVAVFNGLRGWDWLRNRAAPVRWFSALVISSTVAGLATAPFSAATFNMVAAYGLAANLVAVPIMGSLVVPAAVVAALLAPFGLETPALWVMEQGLRVILDVAGTVTDWPGSVRPIVSPPPGLMGALVLGGLWMIIWRGRARWSGAVPVALALALWPLAERPGVLISSSGGLVGVLEADGRSLSRARGDGFVAGIWLENDGDAAEQEEAASRAGWQAAGPGNSMEWHGLRLWHATGVRAADGVRAACRDHDAVVINTALPEGVTPAVLEGWGPESCLMIAPELLAGTGALALSADRGVVTARELQGERLWTSSDLRAGWGYR